MAFAVRRAPTRACCLAAALGVAACGAAGSPVPTITPGGPPLLTRCDGSPIVHAAPTVPPPAAPPSIFVGASPSDVVALAAASGTARWCVHFALAGTYQCPPGAHCPAPPVARVGMPLVAGGVAYLCVMGISGFTYAFNAADGALRWSRATGCALFDIPYADSGQPILADGVLYSGAYGLDPADGSVRWHLPIQATIDAVNDSLVYAFSNDQTLQALSIPDGALRWTYTLDAPIGDRPAVFGDHLYVGDSNGDSPPVVKRGLPDTYALDAPTGALRWRSPTGIVAGSSAVEAAGLVYIGGDNALDALDAAIGAIRWRVVPYNGYVETTPIVAGSTVYFTGDGAYALEAATGAVRWHDPLGWNLSTSITDPALLGGTLYVGSNDGAGQGTLYALDATTGAIRWQRTGFNGLGSPAAA